MLSNLFLDKQEKTGTHLCIRFSFKTNPLIDYPIDEDGVVDTGIDSWDVWIKDKTKTSYEPILESINSKSNNILRHFK